MLGQTKLLHTPPGFTQPFVTYWSGEGRLLRVRPPGSGSGGSDGVRSYEYDSSSGELSRVVAGDQVWEHLYMMSAKFWALLLPHTLFHC